MSPFIMQSFKKIVGANLEKIDKVDFRYIQTYIHTYRQTYGGYLIGPSPAGGPKTMQYLTTWQENLQYANKMEMKEYNTKKNSSWQRIAKDDPRKMWQLIDYKDTATMRKQEKKINPQVIHQYFKGIFQADHLS